MFGVVRTYYKRIQKVYNLAALFYLPNIKKIRKGFLKYEKGLEINQYTITQGKGKVIIGSGCTFGYKIGGFHRGGSIELQARYTKAKIKIGNNISTNNNIFICAANYIEIGDNTLIGQNVTFMDHEAHGIQPDRRRKLGEIGEIKVGKNVWIGNNVSILKNSHIGHNSIVAAGAIVSGNFPDNVILGGVPAKVIKIIND